MKSFQTTRLFTLVSLFHATHATLNVLNEQLQPCSSPGMALTGFTRNGSCVDQDDDAGSHHVCIKMSSNTGGNFCTVTGQSNWCDTEMQCDGQEGNCAVENWCVCEWAFSGYIENANGCEHIRDVDCAATNMMALTHYEERADGDAKIGRALACLKEKCGIVDLLA